MKTEADAAGHDGLTITLDRSETDQTALGARVWIAGAGCRCATTPAATTALGPPAAAAEQVDAAGARPSTNLCPVVAWRAWTRHLHQDGVRRGPAFRPVDRHDQLRTTRLSGRAIADTIATRAAAIGLAGDWGGHSLRRGFATEAYARGNPELEIMRHGRWKAASIMRGYLDEGTRTINPSSNLGA